SFAQDAGHNRRLLALEMRPSALKIRGGQNRPDHPKIAADWTGIHFQQVFGTQGPVATDRGFSSISVSYHPSSTCALSPLSSRSSSGKCRSWWVRDFPVGGGNSHTSPSTSSPIDTQSALSPQVHDRCYTVCPP